MARTQAVGVGCPPVFKTGRGGAALRLDGSIPSPLRGENASSARLSPPLLPAGSCNRAERKIVEEALCRGLGPSQHHRTGARGVVRFQGHPCRHQRSPRSRRVSSSGSVVAVLSVVALGNLILVGIRIPTSGLEVALAGLALSGLGGSGPFPRRASPYAGALGFDNRVIKAQVGRGSSSASA